MTKRCSYWAGVHSPPLIKYRNFINQNNILTLVPWAAGGPITRAKTKENWLFRLSVDDTKAGYRIAQYAVNKGKCQNPYLFLEQTPWGKSNQKTMTHALSEFNLEPKKIVWFKWGLSEPSARIMIRNLNIQSSDCVFLVANNKEGAVIAKAFASFPESQRPRVYSHWGVTAGDFHEQVEYEIREAVDLTFIQSCFSFVSSKPTEVSKRAIQSIRSFAGFQDKQGRDIQAPVGFIHSYDLGKIAICSNKKSEPGI